MSRISEEGGEEDGVNNGQYYASVHFPSSDLAVVTNGQGSLHILETGDRTTTQSWLVRNSFDKFRLQKLSGKTY